jgi:hypothetical protein
MKRGDVIQALSDIRDTVTHLINELQVAGNGQQTVTPPSDVTTPKLGLPFNCRSCGKQVWKHLSKAGKSYYTNSAQAGGGNDKENFHGCKQGTVE